MQYVSQYISIRLLNNIYANAYAILKENHTRFTCDISIFLASVIHKYASNSSSKFGLLFKVSKNSLSSRSLFTLSSLLAVALLKRFFNNQIKLKKNFTVKLLFKDNAPRLFNCIKIERQYHQKPFELYVWTVFDLFQKL